MTDLTPTERAVLETLAYSDIFDYPLRLDEVHRYLPLHASIADVYTALRSATQVDCRSELYFLKGNDESVDIRQEREVASLPTFRLALFYGRILGLMPFVRMVAMTGSLAVRNISKGADMDYMLVTQPGHLWIARAFAVTFGRMLRRFGHTICVNLLVSENALAWPMHDLYSAREMCQMIPITGMDIYYRLRASNMWTESVLPNSTLEPVNMHIKVKNNNSIFQRLLEFPLRGEGGERLEQWAMNFQLKRISHRSQSDETNFSADLCQGNFNNHRKWTDKHLLQRLIAIGLADKPRKSARGYP